MQISRCLLATSAVVALLPLTLRADTEAQNKARQALEQKLNEIEVQPAKPAPKAAPAAKPAPTKAAPAPAAAQPAPAAASPQSPAASQFPSVPQGQTADPDAIAKAREAMRQKVQELQPDVASPPVAAPAATANTPAPAVAAASSAAVAVSAATAPHSSGDSRFSDVPNLPSVNSDAVTKARDAMRQTQVPAAPVVTGPRPAPIVVNQPPPWTVSTPPAPAAPPKPSGKASNFPPMQPPDLPITGDKNQKLADLLQKYKADQITPEEYHSERAKILAGK